MKDTLILAFGGALVPADSSKPLDNCQFIANADQANNAKNGPDDALGDVCDPDDDNDSVLDTIILTFGGPLVQADAANPVDNCQFDVNTDQKNTDKAIETVVQGDVCDDDDDEDGLSDVVESMLTTNPLSADSDNDGIPDVVEVCPDPPAVCDLTMITVAVNTDGTDLIDALDLDSDNDGIDDAVEKTSPASAVIPVDSNGDGTPDFRSVDSDGDTVLDKVDNCRVTPNPLQEDADMNGTGDACDPVTDTDMDGLVNNVDNCVFVANVDQLNHDSDAFGDACDPDDDNDGVDDVACLPGKTCDVKSCDPTQADAPCAVKDNCHFVANGDQLDTDKDGKGNACDEDDDDDGIDDVECAPGQTCDIATCDPTAAGALCVAKDNCTLALNRIRRTPTAMGRATPASTRTPTGSSTPRTTVP